MKNLMVDFYELTMGQVYFKEKIDKKMASFDIFFRKNPDNANFAIAGGISDIIDFILNFHYSNSDIEYLKSLNLFSNDFLLELKNLKFTGDVFSVKEGTIIYPNEPIITVCAPLLQAQLLETALLNIFNFASLIITKTARIVESAKGKNVMEFGSRRAQGFDASIQGAKFAFIGGCSGTACTLTGKVYNIPVLGTMAHSFIQAFDNEYEAFQAYAKSFPDNCIVLLDTYDTINSGLKNAIKLFFEVLKPQGKTLKGVRLDSGNLVTLSKIIREELDKNGLKTTQIIASNSLDEWKIQTILDDKAPIDCFGVGENLICAKSNPVFGGVYKLVAIEKDNKMIPKIKISEDIDKVTNPALKSLYRVYDDKCNMIEDIIALTNEKINFLQNNGKKIEKLQIKYIENGLLINKPLNIIEAKQNVKENLKQIPNTARQLDFKWKYPVKLTSHLQVIKNTLLEEHILNSEANIFVK